MLPPAPMLATKNRICRRSAIFFIALAIFIAGCTPPGPRALLKGKKLLDRGDYADAAAQLKIATSILATNAQAWNYLGLAYHHAGQPADAVVAYNRALMLNRDLVEVHYNLGCLWLEQNRPDAAKTEFTAYTLRRGNAPEGWLKLGLAELHAHELVSAEKSFNTALSLSPDNAGALNGLGLAQIQRGRPREAAQYFAAAIKAHPDCAAAILNLAAIADEYLRDRALALQNYRAYLALMPRPANWDEVNAIVNGLEQKQVVAESKPPPVANSGNESQAEPAPEQTQPKTQTPGPTHIATSPKPPPVHRTYSNPPPHYLPPTEIVEVQPEPVLRTSPEAQEPALQQQPPVSVEASTPPSKTEKTGVLHELNPLNWFHSSAPGKKYEENGITPLPPPNSANDRVSSTPLPPKPEAISNSSAPAGKPVIVPAKPIHIVQPAPPAFPRYLYLSPGKPRTGDRKAAVRAFAEAQKFELEQKLAPAMKSYEHAARLDPSWFEAQYNYGVLAYRLREFDHSLAAYEMALAVQPDSLDARYNFALTLKAAGYELDAVDELKKILASSPDETRAHLALANLYAQQLRDFPQARTHYLKVLELDPANPQATDIRFWLSSNPP
jgi:tetratricopeptide (TPR) repeat protein